MADVLRPISDLPYSPVQYTAISTNDNYAIPWPYLDDSHIHVFLDGVEQHSGWSIQTKGVVNFPGRSAGVLTITRRSDDSEPYVDFNPGVSISTSALNLEAEWQLYISQENRYAAAALESDTDVPEPPDRSESARNYYLHVPGTGDTADPSWTQAADPDNGNLPLLPAAEAQDKNYELRVPRSDSQADPNWVEAENVVYTSGDGISISGTTIRTDLGTPIRLVDDDWIAHDSVSLAAREFRAGPHGTLPANELILRLPNNGPGDINVSSRLISGSSVLAIVRKIEGDILNSETAFYGITDWIAPDELSSLLQIYVNRHGIDPIYSDDWPAILRANHSEFWSNMVAGDADDRYEFYLIPSAVIPPDVPSSPLGASDVRRYHLQVDTDGVSEWEQNTIPSAPAKTDSEKRYELRVPQSSNTGSASWAEAEGALSAGANIDITDNTISSDLALPHQWLQSEYTLTSGNLVPTLNFKVGRDADLEYNEISIATGDLDGETLLNRNWFTGGAMILIVRKGPGPLDSDEVAYYPLIDFTTDILNNTYVVRVERDGYTPLNRYVQGGVNPISHGDLWTQLQSGTDTHKYEFWMIPDAARPRIIPDSPLRESTTRHYGLEVDTDGRPTWTKTPTPPPDHTTGWTQFSTLTYTTANRWIITENHSFNAYPGRVKVWLRALGSSGHTTPGGWPVRTVFDITASENAAALDAGRGRNLAIFENSVILIIGNNGVFLIQSDATSSIVPDLSNADERWEFKIDCWR